jgi:inhibitor of KinA sporulation pathway (predicted exonuclease)
VGAEQTIFKAKFKNQWIKINVEGVKSVMERIYRATKKKDLGMALMKVKDFYRGDQQLMDDAGFLSKLVQLEASGYVEPAINLGSLYNSVIQKVDNETKAKLENS